MIVRIPIIRENKVIFYPVNPVDLVKKQNVNLVMLFSGENLKSFCFAQRSRRSAEWAVVSC